MGGCCSVDNGKESCGCDGQAGHAHQHAHEHDHNGHGSKALRVSLAVGAGLFIAGLIDEHFIHSGAAFWLFLASALSAGWNILKEVASDIKAGQVFTENLLMATAAVGAFLIGEHAEGAAVLVLYTLGEGLQGAAVARSRASISRAMDLRPDRARIIIDGTEREVPPEEVEPGQVMVIKPGEKVPLDGTVIEGKSYLDMSKLTGEFIPKQVEEGSQVLSGTINGIGLIIARVDRPYGMSTAARIMRSVEQAEERKAIPERFIRRFAKYYTPAVFAIAALIAVLPPLLGAGAFEEWTKRALVMLVMSCPCALVISVPLAYFAGMGRISRYGVLVKGAAFVDVLAGLDTVVFDKTGTLTEGSFKVREVVLAGGTGHSELVGAAASAEMGSNHPIASSIVEYAKGMGIEGDGAKPEGYSEIAGSGVIASVNGKSVAVGNRDLMDKVGAKIEAERCSEPFCSHTVANVAVDGSMIGSLHLGDIPKEMAGETVKQLQELGIKRIAMLSGDKRAAAEAIAGLIGVEEVHAELLPDEKMAVLESIIAKARKTAFVGDGVNDAPSLTRADLGIAMGALGSDAAIESADVVVMDDNLAKLPKAIKAARYTRAIAMQNIAGALAVKAFFLILGGSGNAGMVEAIVADVGVSLLTVLNSFRLFTGKD